MHVKHILIILFLISFSCRVRSQTVLLNVDHADEKKFTTEEVGQNLKRFNQGLIRLAGIIPPEKPGARVVYGTSMDLAAGFRKKYKFSGAYSLGWEAEIGYKSYNIKQDAYKQVLGTDLSKKERFNISTIGIGFYNRINFDPQRGNFIGTYLDLVIKGEYAIFERVLFNKLSDGSNGKLILSHLPYTRPFQSELMARFGRGHFALTASYRISKLFKALSGYPELPAMTAGFEFGLY